jgi:hypothetical protein
LDEYATAHGLKGTNWNKTKDKKGGAIPDPALYCFIATGNSQVVTLLFYPIIWFKGFKNVLRGFQH